MKVAKAKENTFANEAAQWIMVGQDAFYFGSGVWPLLSMRTFVTGPKTDKWLVKTVGVLVSVIGGTLGAQRFAKRYRAGNETPSCSIDLSAIDVIYVAKRRISPVYLLDAVAEIGFANVMDFGGAE
jgi:hypothetical protein